uniref:Uncharacterized protein n=1 Tax=Caenorhabditis japonica TaxID=281687 RepID=A0A8R1E2W6_CAEJA
MVSAKVGLSDGDKKVPCKNFNLDMNLDNAEMMLQMPSTEEQAKQIVNNRKYPTGYNPLCPSIFIIKFLSALLIITMISLMVFFVCKRYENSQKIIQFEQVYNDFILKYDRKYPTIEEFEYRFAIFVKNIKEMEEEEKRHPGLDLDVNEFTDWTDEELRKMILDRENEKLDFAPPPYNKQYLENGVKRPASIDYRDQGKLTPVKNQGQCGSCWAFATVASVEAQYAIKKGKLVALSEQELVDCDNRNNGCNGGYRPYAMRFVKENGLETEKDYPYEAKKHDQCSLIQNYTKIFIDGSRMLSSNEEDVADWVGTKGPVTFGMQVVKAMYSYRSGIFKPTEEDCAEKSMGSHALTIVGYGDEGHGAYWIVKNSWGTSWGANGYFRLARGVNSCGMANTVVAPIIN